MVPILAVNPSKFMFFRISVGSEDHAYKLTIGRYASSTSTAGDALKWHNSMKFSTVDRDNDALMGKLVITRLAED